MAGVDRISELPESILHSILSFLSHKQAIQTSALSRTWRHVGPTRPKIVLREGWFWKSAGRESSFLSVLGKTIQRYNHQNLSVNEIILAMSPLSHDDHHDQLMDHHDLGKILSKGLKRLSLISVQIKAETLEKIIRSSPLIEYLRVSGYTGFTTTIPLTIFQAEFLTELHLSGFDFSCGHLQGPNLIVPTDQLLLIKRLKTLSLDRVYIAEETLEKFMCGCPLIQRLLLTDCVGLTKIQLVKYNNNLKYFSAYFDRVRVKSFEIDAPAIETIRFTYCPNWFGHDKYFFPRLKTLYLWRVKLPAQLFKSFSSSNFPSLEDLQLEYCYGFRKIQLTLCSIKRLVININSNECMAITIYAPNIHYFKLSADYPQRLIFNTGPASREWKSQVVMLFNEYKDSMLWLCQLSKLLNSLRESQISLEVFPKPIMNLKVDQDPNDAGFCKPVPVEDVHVEGYHEPSSFPDLLKCLFLICRPRYIVMSLRTINPVTDLKQERDKLSELITFRNEEEILSCRYLWELDLEKISMQVWDNKSKGWHTVGVEGTCFPGFTTSYPRIRFSLKWRD